MLEAWIFGGLPRVAIASIVVALTWGDIPALAHNEAEWIQKNPEYVDQFGNHCCGPDHCERIPESYIREEGRDIHVLPTRQRFRRGDRGAYPSRNTEWWWCKSVQLPGQAQPPAACIF